MDINAFFYISSITLGSFTITAPLYSKTINIVSNGPLNSKIPIIISADIIKEL